MDDLALATAIANNTRFVTAEEDLMAELIDDFGPAKAARIWELACDIFDGMHDNAA